MHTLKGLDRLYKSQVVYGRRAPHQRPFNSFPLTELLARETAQDNKEEEERKKRVRPKKHA